MLMFFPVLVSFKKLAPCKNNQRYLLRAYSKAFRQFNRIPRDRINWSRPWFAKEFPAARHWTRSRNERSHSSENISRSTSIWHHCYKAVWNKAHPHFLIMRVCIILFHRIISVWWEVCLWNLHESKYFMDEMQSSHPSSGLFVSR